MIKMPSEPPGSIPFLGPNKLWIGGSDLRSGAAEAATIPALGSLLAEPYSPLKCLFCSRAKTTILARKR